MGILYRLVERLTCAMKQPVYAKYLEFDNIILDLTDVVIKQNYNESENTEYIIFMNVKKAFYKNFYLKCDLSLETLTVFIYEKLRLTVQQVEFVKPSKFVDCINFNSNDNDNSMIIDLCPDAQIIVAKKIYSNESYHQRVTGFLDFQRRNYIPVPKIVTDQQLRNSMDRELEIKLYELNF